MSAPALPTLIPRQRALLLSAGLVVVITGVSTSDPGPALHGRGVVILILTAIASIAWLAWIWAPPSPVAGDLSIGVMAVSSGLLVPAAPNGPASAFAFAAIVSVAVRYGGVRPMVFLLLTFVALAFGAVVYDQSAIGVVAYGAGMLAAMLASAARRTSLQRAEDAELLLAQTQRSREEQLRAAALDERARIAREIHDVLAHSLAGLTIDLEATRMLVEQGAARERVLERVDRAHALAREGLQETRRAVEALRGDAPRLADQLSALVALFQSGTGRDATLAVDGGIDELPADAALAVVRVTQESLTNVRKHAPGSDAAVSVERLADHVALTVVNGGAGPAARDAVSAGLAGASRAAASGTGGLAASGGGYGLVGMRERAEILGGSLAAGPLGDGWQVQLRLPAGAPRA